jgi:hypothetical protein
VPLTTKRKSGLQYLTIVEAAEARLVTVEEVSEDGMVNAMKVTNQAPLPLFIPDGMMLVGCKQNRVVNISALVPSFSERTIPVSCVERRRWRQETESSAPSELGDPGLRSAICDQSTTGLVQRGNPQANQGLVWKHVDGILESLGAQSPTADYHAAYLAGEHQFRCPSGANGVAIVRDGKICSLDLFDKPETLEKLWSALVRGTIPISRCCARSITPLEDTRRFLAECLVEPQGEFRPIGLGTHHRFRSDRSVGSALVVDGELLHLCAFPKHEIGQSGTPTTSASVMLPIVRPWWRLWR